MIRSDQPIIASEDLLKEYERTGCAHTFEKIVLEHRPYVLSICNRITGNAHDAEDATQAAFLTLSLQARGGNSIHSLKPWLAQVARHVSLDLCKARKRRINHEQAARRVEVLPLAKSRVDEKELQQIIRRQIESLPPRYRTPMILFYFGGMSLPEIGKQLGVNRKALSVRLLRARRMLAQQLSQSSYPWFSVATVSVLLEEAVRSGMWDMTSAAAVPSGRLVASLTPSFFNFGLPAGIKRNIGIFTLVLAALSSVAGSASIAWFGGDLPVAKQLPSISEWLGRKLNKLIDFSLPLRAQSEPVRTQPKHVPIVQVWKPVIPIPSQTSISNLPLPQQIASSYPRVIKGPDFHVSQKTLTSKSIVNGNIRTPAYPEDVHVTDSRTTSHVLPLIARNTRSHQKSVIAEDETLALATSEGNGLTGGRLDYYTTMPVLTVLEDGSTASVTGSYANNITDGSYLSVDGVISGMGLGNADEASSIVIPPAEKQVEISGSVGVPEPAIFGVFAGFFMILGTRRRRN